MGLKALHIACAMVFVSGLLLMALLLVLHRPAAGPAWPQERRLLRAVQAWNRQVVGPALLLLWVLGLTLALRQGLFGAGWLNAKLVLVTGLSALHGLLSGRLRRLARASNVDAVVPAPEGLHQRPALLPAVPVVVVSVLVAIVLLAVGKPG